AAGRGDGAIVKLLLDTGKVDIDSQDKDGKTPLSWAARRGHEAIVKLLLDTGQVDIDSQDKNDRTPLSWAVENGWCGIVELLVESGVDVKGTCGTGWTPLQLAAWNAQSEVERLLWSRGASVSRDFFGIEMLFSHQSGDDVMPYCTNYHW
ncbi:ankyrin, partial [Fusarium beomiforme]